MGDHNHGGDDESSMSSMKMWFHFSQHATILFREWHTMTAGELVGSCFAVAVLAALYEGLKVGRDIIDRRMNASKSESSSSLQSKSSSIISRRWANCRILTCGHFIQTGLHFVQLWISLCLMLVFMTYNVYLCLSVTTGGAVGYFCFAWAKQKNRLGYDSEICH